MECKASAIWLLAGPTASGKSALALRLAEAAGGDIVNADSMQLYADIPILSAQPGPAERARAPHHLYGIADAADPWSAGRWLAASLAILEELRERGRPAIVVGGTGLYFNVLTRGLAELPEVPLPAREAAAARLARMGETAFREALSRVDPMAEAAIAARDRQRLVRAWSVHVATGRALSDWRAATSPPLPLGAWRGVVLDPSGVDLAGRIAARLRRMVHAGAVAEVAALLARRLDAGLPALKAVGVAAFAAHLTGQLPLEAAVERAAGETRRYAKRQRTWFRNQQPGWPRIDSLDLEAQWAALLSLTRAAPD